MNITLRRGSSWAAVLMIGSLLSAPAWARAEEGRSTFGKEARITLSDARGRTTLALEPPVRPDRITGTFTRGNLGVRFSSVSTPDGRIAFVLRALDGRELFSLTQDDECIENKLLGGRLLHRVDLTLLELFKAKNGDGGVTALESAGLFVAGDSVVAKEFLATPELALLPRLSQALGQELGYTGVTHPATLPLHLMARNLNRQGIGRVGPLAPAPLSGNKCESYPNDDNQCYGMCGSGCSCWAFICGDCCYHSGCAEHDSTCRPGYEYSWYYCNIEFWTPFKEGGGCGGNQQ